MEATPALDRARNEFLARRGGEGPLSRSDPAALRQLLRKPREAEAAGDELEDDDSELAEHLADRLAGLGFPPAATRRVLRTVQAELAASGEREAVSLLIFVLDRLTREAQEQAGRGGGGGEEAAEAGPPPPPLTAPFTWPLVDMAEFEFGSDAPPDVDFDHVLVLTGLPRLPAFLAEATLLLTLLVSRSAPVALPPYVPLDHSSALSDQLKGSAFLVLESAAAVADVALRLDGLRWNDGAGVLRARGFRSYLVRPSDAPSSPLNATMPEPPPPLFSDSSSDSGASSGGEDEMSATFSSPDSSPQPAASHSPSPPRRPLSLLRNSRPPTTSLPRSRTHSLSLSSSSTSSAEQAPERERNDLQLRLVAERQRASGLLSQLRDAEDEIVRYSRENRSLQASLRDARSDNESMAHLAHSARLSNDELRRRLSEATDVHHAHRKTLAALAQSERRAEQAQRRAAAEARRAERAERELDEAPAPRRRPRPRSRSRSRSRSRERGIPSREAVEELDEAQLEGVEAQLEQALGHVRRAKERKQREAQERRLREAEGRAHEKKEQALCVACQDRDKNVVLLPCRHMCLCDECANHEALERCPMCRVFIESILNVYA